MKKLALFALLVPTLLFAQEDRKEVNSHEVQKGFYGSISINQLSQYDETFNGKIVGGMHFSNFHIGAHYLTSFGENEKEIKRISTVKDVGVKYSGFGLDLMYEFEVDEKFSVAPFFNTTFMQYEYSGLPSLASSENVIDDNFLNTQIGTKLFFTPNRNFKVGLDIGYNIANDVNLINTESSDLSGLNLGITLQFNHFYPKW